MPAYIAQCDVVLLTESGTPDLVKQGETRTFHDDPPQGRFPKWIPVDAPQKRKATASDIAKRKTGIAIGAEPVENVAV